MMLAAESTDDEPEESKTTSRGRNVKWEMSQTFDSKAEGDSEILCKSFRDTNDLVQGNKVLNETGGCVNIVSIIQCFT